MKVTITIEGKKYPTRKEKERECLEALQHDKNIIVEKPVTLRAAFDRFIEKNYGKIAEQSLVQYAHLRDKHFERIMDMAVGCIGQNELQASFDDEAAKGWAKKTLQNYKYCMKNVLKEVRPDFHPEIIINAQK